MPSFYEPQYAADGTLSGYRPRLAPDAPVPVRKAALQDHRSGRSAGDRHLHARHRIRLALPRSRSSAAAPTCAASAGPATTTCRSARFRPTAFSSSPRPRAAIRQPRRPGVDRALRSPRHRADPGAPARDGLRDQPGVAAPRRSHRADRPDPARRAASARITIAPETGSDRLRRVINKTVTNDEILDRAELIFASGIENLKLYYMIGLPTETDDDLVAIRDLTLQLRDRMLKHARAARHDRPHRRQREPADSEARHRLSVAADGRPDARSSRRSSGCAA